MGVASPNFLYCAVCWFLPAKDESDAVAAVSIANGYALCKEHMTIHPTPSGIRALIYEIERMEQDGH